MCVRLDLPEWLTALSQPGVQSAQLTLSGSKAVASSNRLLTTVAYQLDGKRTYALEGAIFIAGAAVQWLRVGLKLVKKAADTARP
jgi:glycerol kinase